MMGLKKIWAWFDASGAVKFGIALAQFFIDKNPLGVQKNGPSKKEDEKYKETIRKMLFKIQIYKLEYKLNGYQKAKLSNAFKWALRDAGYDDALVNELTKALLLAL